MRFVTGLFVLSFFCVVMLVGLAVNGWSGIQDEKPSSADKSGESEAGAVATSKLTFLPKLELLRVSLYGGPAFVPSERFQYAFGETKAVFHGVVDLTVTNVDSKTVNIDPMVETKAWLLTDAGESATAITHMARDAAFRLIRVGDNQPITLETGQSLTTNAVFELAFIPDSPRTYWFAIELGQQLATRRFQLDKIGATKPH